MRIEDEKNILERIFYEEESKDLYDLLKRILGLDENGYPNVVNGKILFFAWKRCQKISVELELEAMNERYIDKSEERYELLQKKHMKQIESTFFEMGAYKEAQLKYCGEEPLHSVELSTFLISDEVVTKDIYSIYLRRDCDKKESKIPMTNVSWYDAFMFCKWINCRLPTEAEWEWASRGGTKGSYWCCDSETDLHNYAWYSENSDGKIHLSKLLLPNKFGLYDMHGNVWEWCADTYDENYYSHSPIKNPINMEKNKCKVCRGGSINAFSEMCRCNFRNYESAELKAEDIGFRVAKTV